jgi:hypothetical protein
MKVKLDNQEVEISKLPLGKYADLLKALKELPKHFETISNLDTSNNQAIMADLPRIIGESYPDVVRILEIATPLKKEEIEELGLNETIDIVVAIVEVNRFKDVYSKVKKAMTVTQPTELTANP